MIALALTWRPSIAPLVAAPTFPSEQIARGATLAKLGDCSVCHTTDDGRLFAGGRAIATPFGTIYASNITPDRRTGIGAWRVEAFRRAMTQGVSRDGHRLYPALPYEHFTHVEAADLDDLYAFLMTRTPVEAKTPGNRLIPPLGFRPLLAGWQMLFLHKGPTSPDPSRSAAWNRGAYLVEGLGHCGACHTPRNALGAEDAARAYAGAPIDGWRAPALDGHNPALRPWTQDALYTYFKTGLSPDHSAAGGPMGPVVQDLSGLPDSDLRAIALYISSRMPAAVSTKSLLPIDHAAAAAQAFPQGARLFAGACAGCHDTGAPMMGQGRPDLSLASDVRDDDPTSATAAIMGGIAPPVAGRGPLMPPFGDSLTDFQAAALLAYVRARYSDRPAWRDLPNHVHKARKEGATS